MSREIRPRCPKHHAVGAAGFEPTTSCSQSRRAAKLRYAPSELRFQVSAWIRRLRRCKDRRPYAGRRS